MKEALRLSAFTFLILLPWIFFDVDLGDQAYSNVSSWLMAFHPQMPASTYPVWFEAIPAWFSFFVDALWWKIIGPDASLIWSRVGWILWNVIISLGLFSLLKKSYDQRKLANALILTVLVVNCAADHYVLTYNSVPPALGALSIAAYLVGTPLTLVLSGILVVFTIQARLPSVLFLGLFFLLALIMERKKWKNIFYLIGGAALGGVLSYLALLFVGQETYIIPGIKSFFQGVSSASNQRYTKGAILMKAFGHYARITSGALAFYILSKLTNKKFSVMFQILFAAAFSAVVYIKYGVALSFVIGGALYIICLKWRSPLPILAALTILVAFTFGTYLDGVQNYKYGMWILMPLALLAVDNERTKRLMLISIFSLFIITRLEWPTFPYLEKNIFSMTRPMENKTLKGIFSYTPKQQILDETANELTKLGLKPGDTFLCYSGIGTYYPISVFYQMTKTIPLLHDPALTEYPGSRWVRNKTLLGVLPNIILRQKQFFPRMPSGITQAPIEPIESAFQWSTGAENGLAGEMDEILKARGYTVAWENRYFVILTNKN